MKLRRDDIECFSCYTTKSSSFYCQVKSNEFAMLKSLQKKNSSGESAFVVFPSQKIGIELRWRIMMWSFVTTDDKVFFWANLGLKIYFLQ